MVGINGCIGDATDELVVVSAVVDDGVVVALVC